MARSKTGNDTEKKREKERHRRYLIVMWIGVMGWMGIEGGINYVVDPYGVYGSREWRGWNHSKPKKETYHDRLYKALDIEREKPDVLILGSSRVKRGIDPEYIKRVERGGGVKKLRKLKVYNGGLDEVNVYEMRRYLEHAVMNSVELKEVIVGLDFYMFNEGEENKKSFRDIKKFELGLGYYSKMYKGYRLSERYLGELRKIIEICKRGGIQLKIFISPGHSTDLEEIKLSGNWGIYEEWKRRIIEISEGGVWDFETYNSVTKEKIKNQMKNYADNFHYVPRVGNWIVDRIEGVEGNKIPIDFGILVNKENIEREIEEVRRGNQRWMKEQPADLEMVRRIWRTNLQK